MKLTYIMFTKHLEGLGVPEIIDSLNSVGVQGADLCVHPGYPVNPGNIDQELPRAARPPGAAERPGPSRGAGLSPAACG
ncbi:MAG: hypothetical protein QGF67_12600 [Lentisphaeria bacterium]|jgi:hypothetical protein|nr:hypothetical protein [Lentisphaeria bacterium]MDP7742275.1 hypothetical protein [Lentisphaeria bacterium]